jgi:hypothetical protein
MHLRCADRTQDIGHTIDRLPASQPLTIERPIREAENTETFAE